MTHQLTAWSRARLRGISFVAATLSTLLFLAGCLPDGVDGPETGRGVVMALTMSDSGAEELTVEGFRPLAGLAPLFVHDPAPVADVRMVDDARDVVLADLRIGGPTPLVGEAFPTSGGIEGERVERTEVERLIAAPEPTSGRVRVSVRQPQADGTESIASFLVSVLGGGNGAGEDVPSVTTIDPATEDFALPAGPRRDPAAVAAGGGGPDGGPIPEVDTASAGDAPTSSSRCGNGTHDDGEACDDGNEEDGDGCSASCTHELTHLAGATSPSGTVSFVFVPTNWMSEADFIAYARNASEGTLATAPFSDFADRLSFWALTDLDAARRSGLPRLPAPDPYALCGDSGDMQKAVDEWRIDHLATAVARGTDEVVSPIFVVASHGTDCRSYGLTQALSLGNDPRIGVLTHELGHTLAALPDEYSDAGWCADRGFFPYSPNISKSTPLEWACAEGETTCPGGGPVGHNPVGGGCDADLGTPCPACMMRDATTDFCPICQLQVSARLWDLLGMTPAEECDGGDNDLDDTADEGCSCVPMCGEEGEPCSGSGPEFDDECCGDLYCVVGACRPAEGERERASCEPGGCASGLSCRPVGSADAERTCCAANTDYCTEKADCCGLMDCVMNHCVGRVSGEECLSGDCDGASFCDGGVCT